MATRSGGKRGQLVQNAPKTATVASVVRGQGRWWNHHVGPQPIRAIAMVCFCPIALTVPVLFGCRDAPPSVSEPRAAYNVFTAKPHKAVNPADIAKTLRSKLPTGWTLKSDALAIVIARDEPVTLLNLISLPSHDYAEVLPEFGRKTDYLILLVFIPRMDDQQFLELKGRRDAAFRKIAADRRIDGKTKYGHASQERRRNPLPDYFNSRFSAYLHRTDGPDSRVFPESAALERDAILGALSDVMDTYER